MRATMEKEITRFAHECSTSWSPPPPSGPSALLQFIVHPVMSNAPAAAIPPPPPLITVFCAVSKKLASLLLILDSFTVSWLFTSAKTPPPSADDLFAMTLPLMITADPGATNTPPPSPVVGPLAQFLVI